MQECYNGSMKSCGGGNAEAAFALRSRPGGNAAGRENTVLKEARGGRRGDHPAFLPRWRL